MNNEILSIPLLSGQPIDISTAKKVVISVAAKDATVKCQGSLSGIAPDFSKAQSPTNAWAYIQMLDLSDGSSVDGDIGTLVDSGVRLFSVPVPVRWLNLEIVQADGPVSIIVHIHV